MPNFADPEQHPDIDDFAMTDAGVAVGRMGNPSGIGVLWPYSTRRVTVLTATEARSLAYHLLRAIDPNSEERLLALTPSRLRGYRSKVEANRKRRAARRADGALKIQGIA